MMNRYYFLSTALPSLNWGAVPEITFKELYDLASMNLSAHDLVEFQILLQPIDLYNVKALWLALPLDDRGNFSGKELEEALLIRDLLPPYLIEYVEEHESTENRLRYFSSLYASMYRQEWKGFLGLYFNFEREVRLVLAALRAKKMGRDIVYELQFEDPLDSFVAQIFSQKDMPDYIPPMEYEDLKTLFMENSSDPRKLSLALMKYRFEKIGEWEENEHFTLDWILAYGAKLLILESGAHVDKEKANIAVEELSKYG